MIVDGGVSPMICHGTYEIMHLNARQHVSQLLGAVLDTHSSPLHCPPVIVHLFVNEVSPKEATTC
jgi:hypothetical protein